MDVQRFRFYAFNEEGKYVVKGPVAHPRTPDEEQTMTVAIIELDIRKGTPVVCHGLKNAAHLNGKIGDVRSFDDKIERYGVHFEDKNLKSALVKPENLQIVFELIFLGVV